MGDPLGEPGNPRLLVGFSLLAPHACNSSSWGGQEFQASLIYSVQPCLNERGRRKDIPLFPM